jgi:hypothetical protein
MWRRHATVLASTPSTLNLEFGSDDVCNRALGGTTTTKKSKAAGGDDVPKFPERPDVEVPKEFCKTRIGNKLKT